MCYSLDINPFDATFQFLNERDLVEFLIVRFLFEDKRVFDFTYDYDGVGVWWHRSTGYTYKTFNIISYPSFKPYPAIIEQTRLFLKNLRSNYFLDSLGHYLSSISGTSNNLAYGYCRLPGTPSKNIESEISKLLALGFNPTGTDRWGRSLHTMFLLTEQHWDLLFNHYSYPLISSSLFLFLARLVPSEIYFGSLRAIILSEKQLISILIKSSQLVQQLNWNQTFLHDTKYHLIAQTEFLTNQQQIAIIFDTLIVFLNKLEMLRQIKYSPPFGKFPGGIEYHSSYVHFLSLR